jgi:hypothetical protein
MKCLFEKKDQLPKLCAYVGVFMVLKIFICVGCVCLLRIGLVSSAGPW